MYQDIKVNDACLRGKHIIGEKDIINLFPEEMRKEVEVAYVFVNLGQAQWVIFLKDDVGGYTYQPFSKEMVYDPYIKKIDWGRIFFWRKSRYLRDHYINKGTEKKVFTVYICRPKHMILWREVKRYELEDKDGPGYSTKSRWLRAYP